MGIFRFLLAALVVLFHFGGLGWIVGRIAVFAFYGISGFLIFQVLDRVYLSEPRGIPRFFCNRFVRLVPLYLVYTVLTLAMVRGLGPQAIVDPAGRRILRAPIEATSNCSTRRATFGPDVEMVGSMPVLQFIPRLIPQGWSIGVEGTFYLLAPLVVLTTRRRAWALAGWIGVGLLAFLWGVRTAGIDLDLFQTVVYKNAVASAVVFFMGGAFYYLRRRWGQPLPFVAIAIPMLAWVAVVTIPALEYRSWTGAFCGCVLAVLWLTLLLAGLVSLTQVRKLRAFDINAGNLCYGVYPESFPGRRIASPRGRDGYSVSGRVAVWLRGVARIDRARVRHVPPRRASIRSRQGSSPRRLQSAAHARGIWRATSSRRAGGCSVPDPPRQPGGAGGRIRQPVERCRSCPRHLHSTFDGGPGRLMAIDRASRPIWGSLLSDRSRGIQAIARGPTVSAHRRPIACVRFSNIGRSKTRPASTPIVSRSRSKPTR